MSNSAKWNKNNLIVQTQILLQLVLDKNILAFALLVLFDNFIFVTTEIYILKSSQV